MPDILDDPLTFVRNRSLAGGQNNKVFPTQIREDQAAELRDVDISTPGRREKRRGFDPVGNDAGNEKITALADFSPEGKTQRLLHRAGKNLREFFGTGSWSDIATNLADDIDADIIQAFNIAFILQADAENVRSYDGATLTDEGNTNTDTPRTTHGVYALNRLFLAGDQANPTFLYYSDVLDPQTWNRTNNAVKFDEGGGDFINGVVSFSKNELIAATNRNLHSLDISNATPSNWIRQLIIPGFGCIARRTLKRVGNDVWFMSQDGHIRSIIRTQEDNLRGRDPIPLTESIEPYINGLDRSKISQSDAVFFEDAFWVAVPQPPGARNTNIIKIDTKTLGVTIYRGWNVQSWLVSDLIGNEERLYGGESQADTRIYRFDFGTNDNGVVISYSETSRRFDFGLPEADKRFQFVEIEAIATADDTLTVETSVDGGSFVSQGTISLKGNALFLAFNLPAFLTGELAARGKLDLDDLERGRDIQVRLTQASLDVEVKILSLSISALIENVENE